MADAMFTRAEVKHIFGVKSSVTIWQWEQKGILKPACYISGRPRYAIEDIEQVPTLIQQTKSKLIKTEI